MVNGNFETFVSLTYNSWAIDFPSILGVYKDEHKRDNKSNPIAQEQVLGVQGLQLLGRIIMKECQVYIESDTNIPVTVDAQKPALQIRSLHVSQ